MSGFSLSTVEPLDYDFRGFESNTKKGKCKAHGTIPEPTTERLEAYQQAIRDLYGVSTDEEANKAVQDESDLASEKKADQLLALTADLCQQSPSTDDLKELRPRARTAFMKWVHKELVDPKMSTADTDA